MAEAAGLAEVQEALAEDFISPIFCSVLVGDQCSGTQWNFMIDERALLLVEAKNRC